MLPRRTHLVLALFAALALPALASADTTFTFTGHGYGHGVGMGQYGAQGYALQGWTHEQILAHYYQGTTLGPTTFTQVRVLLEDAVAQVTASAPAGLAAADEGGTATLAIPGPGAVTVRKDADGFALVDATGAVLAHGWTGPVSLAASDGGPVTLAGAALNGLKDGSYRGRLRVLASTGATGGLQAVNVVSLENYLLGVVASEMPSSWKPEALEAQAIAARTYAVATRKPASSPYDLYPDERSQVYRGIAAESPASSAAVTATAGQVVLYQGQPIVTYFSSSTGGRSANVEEGITGAAPEPYLVSVDDPYDTISPYHDWTLSLSDRDLSQQAIYPGLVTGIQIDAYPSGRVNTVTFNGSAGPLVLSAALVRKRLGLRSTWFTATPGAPVPKTAAQISLHARVVRNRVLLTGIAPPGAVTLQAAASAGWRDIATHPVADDTAVAFRRPVGETSRYRLLSGTLASAPGAGDQALRPAPARPSRCAPERAALPEGRARRRRAPARGARPLDLGRARDDAPRRHVPLRGARRRRSLARALARRRQLPRLALARAPHRRSLARLDAHRSARGARVEPHRRRRVHLLQTSSRRRRTPP